jgi:ribosome-associated protein
MEIRMPIVHVTPSIAIDEADLEERFVLASGPGGQNVNKVASAVQLRFDIVHARMLSDEVRARLRTLAGRRLTREGVLVLHGNRFRSQDRNRADVRARLFELIRQAAVAPVKRRKTRPPRASKERRIKGKVARGMLKRARAKPELD